MSKKDLPTYNEMMKDQVELRTYKRALALLEEREKRSGGMVSDGTLSGLFKEAFGRSVTRALPLSDFYAGVLIYKKTKEEVLEFDKPPMVYGPVDICAVPSEYTKFIESDPVSKGGRRTGEYVEVYRRLGIYTSHDNYKIDDYEGYPVWRSDDARHEDISGGAVVVGDVSELRSLTKKQFNKLKKPSKIRWKVR